METEKPKDIGTFVDVKVETFTTNDIAQNKGNYPGYMKTIFDKLQSNITFYEISFLKVKGAESGATFKSWIKIDSRWLFFPKMGDPFEPAK